MNDSTKRKNVIVEKSYNLALEIIKVYQQLKDQREFDLARQLLRSGTSIGANIQEAQSAQSRKDFVHKLSIAQKESKETIYWINLLKDSSILESSKASTILELTTEVDKILASILVTTKNS
jgi:four helix bundle protein